MAFDIENGIIRNVEEQKIAYKNMKQAKRDMKNFCGEIVY